MLAAPLVLGTAILAAHLRGWAAYSKADANFVRPAALVIEAAHLRGWAACARGSAYFANPAAFPVARLPGWAACLITAHGRGEAHHTRVAAILAAHVHSRAACPIAVRVGRGDAFLVQGYEAARAGAARALALVLATRVAGGVEVRVARAALGTVDALCVVKQAAAGVRAAHIEATGYAGTPAEVLASEDASLPVRVAAVRASCLRLQQDGQHKRTGREEQEPPHPQRRLRGGAGDTIEAAPHRSVDHPCDLQQDAGGDTAGDGVNVMSRTGPVFRRVGPPGECQLSGDAMSSVRARGP